MGKSIREIVAERLKGFEYRQEARQRERAAATRAKQKRAMLNEYGTLKGARHYLTFKGIDFIETADAATGELQIAIPAQIVLKYDSEGRFLGAAPHRP
jgi:hypothetical protein